MLKDTEIIKFEAKEKALQNEIKRNPIPCASCSMWQHGGDMSVALKKCNDCGEKRAKPGIEDLLKSYAEKRNITRDCAWDIANSFLKQKQLSYKNRGDIYFDEDHFYWDLKTYFNLRKNG